MESVTEVTYQLMTSSLARENVVRVAGSLYMYLDGCQQQYLLF